MPPLNFFELLPSAWMRPSAPGLDLAYALLPQSNQAPQTRLVEAQFLAEAPEAASYLPPVAGPGINHPAAIESAQVGHRSPRLK
jgi:hypothetical protein